MVSSSESSSEFSGNVSGELLDLTTDQTIIQKKTFINLKGDFPKQQVKGIDFKMMIDHFTSEAPKQTVKAKVASYPVGTFVLSKSESAYFAIKDAYATSTMDAVMKDDLASILLSNSFNQVNYDIKSKTKMLEEILKGAVANMPTLFVNAKATGKWGNLDVDIDSNLGKALGDAIKNQIQGKITAEKNKIKKMMNDKIKTQKDKLTNAIRWHQK